MIPTAYVVVGLPVHVMYVTSWPACRVSAALPRPLWSTPLLICHSSSRNSNDRGRHRSACTETNYQEPISQAQSDSYLRRLRTGQQPRCLERPRPRVVDLQVPTSPHPYSVLPFTVYNCDFVFLCYWYSFLLMRVMLPIQFYWIWFELFILIR